MKCNFKLTIVLLLLITNCLTFAQENSLLWEVKKDEDSAPSYLYGTFHVQDKRIFSFEKSLYKKMSACDVLAVELILDQINPVELQKVMLLEEGVLSDYMTEKEYALLDSVVKAKTGQSVAFMIKMKPFFLSSQLMMMDMPKDMPMALDMHFIDTARDMNMEVVALETLQEQIGAIDKMSVEDQVRMLLDGIENYDETVNENMAKLINAYVNQDLVAINELMDDPSLPKEFSEELLISRNHIMVKGIRKLMKKKTVFAAFGAAHLLGEEGVINLLRDKGYTVTPVKISFDNNDLNKE